MKKVSLFLMVSVLLLFLASCATGQTINKGEHTNDATIESNPITEPMEPNYSTPLCDEHHYVEFVCTVCACSLWNGEVDTSWYSVVEEEFTIETADAFAGLVDLVNHGTDFKNSKITLANHLDLNGIAIAPIGATSATVFAGDFEGNGNTVSNILVNADSITLYSVALVQGGTGSGAVAGLFGYCLGNVTNLHIKNLNIEIVSQSLHKVDVGCLIAHTSGEIANCSVQGRVLVRIAGNGLIGGIAASATGNIVKTQVDIIVEADFSNNGMGTECMVAGLVAKASNNTLSESVSKGNLLVDLDAVSGFVGGIIGEAAFSNVLNSYSTVDITVSSSSSAYVGGLIGELRKSKIQSCYAAGDVSLNCYNYGSVSGIGYVGASEGTLIKNCLVMGNLICQTEGENNSVGIFCNNFAPKFLENCFYRNDLTITGKNIYENGTPVSKNNLTDPLLYTVKMGWDTKTWNIVEGAYPTLK